MSDWTKNVRISFDLVQASINQIEFLEDVQALPQLFESTYIEQAIYRYESLWIPLLSISSESVKDTLYPPIDVAWIWHCHLLCPTKYAYDMKKLCAQILDHKLLSRENRSEKQLRTTDVWEQNTNASFNFLSANAVDKHEFKKFKSQISYNLMDASFRQADFFYNVSMPHFKNEKFLKLALDRYKKFLYLKQTYPECLVVPCYAIDIMWHSHQLHPMHYAFDTVQILGQLFPHDDSINDRSLSCLIRDALNLIFTNNVSFFI